MIDIASESFMALVVVVVVSSLALAAGCAGGPAYLETVLAQQVVPVSKHAEYKALLPEILDMPAQPTMLVQSSLMNDTSYLEGVIFLRASHRGVESWYALTQPLNNQLGRGLDLGVGYPKYLAQFCLDSNPSSYTAQMDVGLDCSDPKMTLFYSPDSVDASNNFDLESTFGGQFSISDGCLKFTELPYTVERADYDAPGTVEVTNNYQEPWSSVASSGAFQGYSFKGRMS